MKRLNLLERDITKHIRDYLHLKKIFHYKVWQGLGSQKGIPDIAGILPGGQALYIEVKTAKGRLSKDQEAFLENARQAGAKAFMARSVDDVVRELAA